MFTSCHAAINRRLLPLVDGLCLLPSVDRNSLVERKKFLHVTKFYMFLINRVKILLVF